MVPQGFRTSRAVWFRYREVDLGGTGLGPRMGVGILGLLGAPLLLGSASLVSIDAPCRGSRSVLWAVSGSVHASWVPLQG